MLELISRLARCIVKIRDFRIEMNNVCVIWLALLSYPAFHVGVEQRGESCASEQISCGERTVESMY